MSAAMTVQPIAGVSATRETPIEAVYPSVAANPLGQVIGMIMGAGMSLPFLPLRLLVLIALGAILLPLGFLIYFWTKVFGYRYVVTNRSIQVRKVIGPRMVQQVPLTDIAEIEVDESLSGYRFHRVGQLNLLNAQGALLLSIPAVPYPGRLRRVILDTRDSRLRTDESLAHIQSR